MPSVHRETSSDHYPLLRFHVVFPSIYPYVLFLATFAGKTLQAESFRCVLFVLRFALFSLVCAALFSYFVAVCIYGSESHSMDHSFAAPNAEQNHLIVWTTDLTVSFTSVIDFCHFCH